jgi:hypothetical protein
MFSRHWSKTPYKTRVLALFINNQSLLLTKMTFFLPKALVGIGIQIYLSC